MQTEDSEMDNRDGMVSAAEETDGFAELKIENLGPCSAVKKIPCVKGKLADFPVLETIIPSQYDYHVCECSPDANGFKATLRLPFLTKQECQQWKTDLEGQTFSTFRVLKTFPKCKHKIVYKIVYRCQHSNVHKRKDSKKGTDCRAMLEFTIKKVYSQSKTKDFHLPDLPCVIKLYWIHNHDFTSTEMLKFRDVSDSTREELLSLLRQGHIAPSALKELKARLKSKLGDDYETAALDRRFVPDIGFVKRLQKEIYGRGYKQSPTDLVQDLCRHIRRHTRKHSSTAAVRKLASGHVVVAIATEFMKRVCYHLKESGDVLLVKTTGDKNRYSCRVYLLLTLCCAGGLPVGCLITTSDVTSTLVQGLQLYLSLLSDTQAFFGRGHPAVVMAEDSSSEADAMRVVFPHSTQLLSTYHVLKSAWTWFFGHRKSHVQKKKKPYMFSLLKRMVVSTCAEEIDHFEKIISSEYPSVTTYVAYLYAKKELWGLCFRGSYPIYSNYIYNYVDFEMGALNERVLSGINNLNVIELFDLILSKVETYYRGKISGESNLQDQMGDGVVLSIPMSDVNRVEERIFVVKCQFSSLRHFVVNTDLNVCTCFAGFNGGFCEHQASVQKYFGDSFDQIAKFTCLATGKHFQDSWYHFLQLEEVAKSYEVMEAYTAETNDLEEDEDDEEDGDNAGGGGDSNSFKNCQQDVGVVDTITDDKEAEVGIGNSNRSSSSSNTNNLVNKNKQRRCGGRGEVKGEEDSGGVNCDSVKSNNDDNNKTRTRGRRNGSDRAKRKNCGGGSGGSRQQGDCVVADDSTTTKSKTSSKRTRGKNNGVSNSSSSKSKKLRVCIQSPRGSRGRGRRRKVKEEEEESDESSDEELMKSDGKRNGDANELFDNGVDDDVKMKGGDEDDTEDEDGVKSELVQEEVFSTEQTVCRIREVCKLLEQRVCEKPSIFIPPVNDFLSGLMSPKTDRQLVSALVSFGRKNS